MVRAKGQHVFVGLVLCALSSAGLAQHAPRSNPQGSHVASPPLVDSSSSRPLNSDEGMAVIGAALQARNTLRPYGDCSHLVHTIYEQAGFHYPYADSTDLYSGIPEFRQVTRPQPGDLAVWRGHAAILVNPAQHTFFSATRSGLRVESYDLAYWKRRGMPRFFRYIRSASLNSVAITRSADSTTNPRNFGSSVPPGDAKVADERPNNVDNESTLDSPAGAVLVHSLQPTPQQLSKALSQYLAETEKSLPSQDVLRSSQSVIVFDQIAVKNVRIKKDQAWVEVAIEGAFSLAAGRLNTKRRSEQQRWVLVHKGDGIWELQIPPERTYLQHDAVVRLLAHQLAALADHSSEGDDSSKEQAQLARKLNLLLEK